MDCAPLINLSEEAHSGTGSSSFLKCSIHQWVHTRGGVP
jgi:hypothetical protein